MKVKYFTHLNWAKRLFFVSSSYTLSISSSSGPILLSRYFSRLCLRSIFISMLRSLIRLPLSFDTPSPPFLVSDEREVLFDLSSDRCEEFKRVCREKGERREKREERGEEREEREERRERREKREERGEGREEIIQMRIRVSVEALDLKSPLTCCCMYFSSIGSIVFRLCLSNIFPELVSPRARSFSPSLPAELLSRMARESASVSATGWP